MHIESIRLVGSGGHALVVLDSLAALGVPTEAIAVFDQNDARVGHQIGEHKVQAFDPANFSGRAVHICIGDNKARERVSSEIAKLGCNLQTIIHPRAIVSARAVIGEGTFVAAGAIVSAQAVTGKSCIINHASVVDHECILSDFVHIAPGATLGGAVSVGHRSLIGAGANILPRVAIAPDVTIGAGAVLIKNVTESAVYVGVPAKKV
ncbi:acetyltransferase [Devosia oryziradicis]|uniref:Acetyltransferase n=1 Tax=Devosia oryziradicis TaxID=2801335 RepID=A0ABX7BWD1_9HYPH|nr:acetyltransferase [Devosia oryziradicis]QQR35349.1 acetyltransferase [Devosia oryziradicis]